MFVQHAARGQQVGKRESDRQLTSAINEIVRGHQGDVAVAIEHLTSGEFVRLHADRAMPTASLIKFPLLVATYDAVGKGTVNLDEPITLREADKVPGSGVLTDHFSAGISMPLRDYVRLMIRYSDNTATNVVIDQVGLSSTAKRMDSIGCENTKLNSKVYRGDTSIFPDRSRRFGIGSTTAGEMVRLFKMLHRGELASKELTTEMTQHLLSCEDESKLSRFLPEGIEIAHKTGGIANCRTDAGIIYTQSGPVAVCVLTNKNEDQRWSDDNAANELCAEIGRAVVDRFGGTIKSDLLQRGAFGRMVESLQRTLNKRLTPSPELSIDGDFGPATQRAVERFQSEHELEATGKVDRDTWSALGTLIEHDAPVPSPEEIQNEILPTEASPSLADPPIVTCKAWAIGDTKGNVLWDFNSESKLEAASTTKIMTAYVVLGIANTDPTALEEVIDFSERADQTPGSTSGLRAGETLTVRELLYGLLLPSGNDASVALAEHFGRRLHSSDSAQLPYESFIAAMNQSAFELGIPDAHYVNPHGLPDSTHVISAQGLLKLSAAARKDELFRKIVQTRQYGCRIKSNLGYERNVLWKNTNRLLGFEGYTGIKTGTTSAAGACLAACGKRGDHELLVVVLGSSSSAARYADTRNLFRWAWGKLEASDDDS